MNKCLLLLFTLCATVANAGARVNQETYVYTYPSYGFGFAGGSIAGAYNSADSNQKISCTYQRTGIGTSNEYDTVSCAATNAAGVQGSCTFPWVSDWLRATLATITDTTFIEFQWNTSTGLCTYLSVSYSSLQVPRNPSLSTTSVKTVTPSRAELEARLK